MIFSFTVVTFDILTLIEEKLSKMNEYIIYRSLYCNLQSVSMRNFILENGALTDDLYSIYSITFNIFLNEVIPKTEILE